MSMQSEAFVASKNVALRMDVVKKLDRMKRRGESYSDVIDRFVAGPTSFMDALQYAKEHPVDGPDTLTPRIKEIRKELNRSFEERRRRHAKMP